ncbi:carbohydrate ABC transporter permease [Leuconostoc lactis]|uniref:carbohydrate ABC transporter permease n=1 Tax=Leuconostoc lactis TaxID=1246 RepID=UPI0011BB1CBD|nr:carbohydrate ABC transporter permease [Leuconostoc lactis]QEA50145.1 carbohydrate ABC transporter permease [Leuconostoc lactis]
MIIPTQEKIWRYTLLLCLSLLIFAPVLVGVWVSLLPNTAILNGQYLSTALSFDNYRQALTQTPILRYLFNSFVVASLVMVGQVVFSALAAYAFVFIPFKGKNVIFYAFIATMMLPFEAQLIPNFQTLRWLGFLNHYAALALPFFATAFGTFLLRQAFMQVPMALRESALVEGIGHGQFLYRAVLPYAKTSLLTLAAYSFLTTWNMYLWPLITSYSDNVRTVQIGLRQLQATEAVNSWGLIMASAILMMIPSLVVLLVSQTAFKSGLIDGAVKS